MTTQLDARGEAPARLVLYGDFNCPWSYLASRRAALLERAGVQVDWRAVEHDPWRPLPFTDSSVRFERLRAELDQVERLLLAGEPFPHALSGFLPYSRAAVSGYAEAYGAGVAARVRTLLFEAFWVHGADLGDARLVRTLLVDAIRSGSSPSDLLHDWGYAVDVTGGPVTTTAWRLVKQWAGEWQGAAHRVVPLLRLDDGTEVPGVAAVRWLGDELVRRGVDVERPIKPPARRRTDPPSLSWVSQHGNRWMRQFQALHQPSPFSRAG
jgi:hypothetical protein